MSGKIGIIDYGLGNLRSVQKAFEHLDFQAAILPRADDAHDCARLILPGVGAYADGMAGLERGGWIPVIRQHIESGKPLLGICLGMQLLFEGSEEDAAPGKLVPGLGLLPGTVRAFTPGVHNGRRIKVPHMGWNTLHWTRRDPLLEGLDQGCSAYFVHGYYCVPTESDSDPITTARSEHPAPFTATAWRDNIWATQFHPEKSKDVGLTMLANFARLQPVHA